MKWHLVSAFHELGEVKSGKISDGISLIDYEYVELKPDVHLCKILDTWYIDKPHDLNRVDKSLLKLYNIETHFIDLDAKQPEVVQEPTKKKRRKKKDDKAG